MSGRINGNNLLKEEHLSLKDLMKNTNLIIQNADKGNIAVLNKNDYISKRKVILSNSSKFQQLSIDQNKVLNEIEHLENRIIDALIKLKNKKINEI